MILWQKSYFSRLISPRALRYHILKKACKQEFAGFVWCEVWHLAKHFFTSGGNKG